MVTSEEIARDCAFCAIVRGEVPATVVAEDAECIAFFPDEQATLGHTLVVPKAHVSDLWAIERRELISQLMEMVIRIGRALEVVVEPEGMNLITSDGAAASQTVFHLHLHVVPRWPDDRMGNIWPEGGVSLGTQTEALAQELHKVYDAQVR